MWLTSDLESKKYDRIENAKMSCDFKDSGTAYYTEECYTPYNTWYINNIKCDTFNVIHQKVKFAEDP